MFRTPINIASIKSSDRKIDYRSKVLMIGSCFVENIGEKLDYYKFDTLVNPYGILFHPLAILKLFQDIKNQRVYSKKDLVYHHELWHSMHHHSDLSHPDKNVVLSTINQQIKNTREYLSESSHIVITLGTAWVYHFIEQDTLVANCHKIPAERFVKRLLTVKEIQSGLSKIVQFIQDLAPQAQIIFTLSPVRHLRDGMIDNMHSKARLLTAIHHTIDQHSTYYFPSFEIMMDDLRDYRFYKDNMLHPNTLAINYIWDIFKDVWISSEAEETMQKVDKVQKGLQHKPNFTATKAHQAFVRNLDQLKKDLKRNKGIEF